MRSGSSAGAEAAAVELGAGGVAGGEGLGVGEQPAGAGVRDVVEAGAAAACSAAAASRRSGVVVAALGAGEDRVPFRGGGEAVAFALGVVDRRRCARAGTFGGAGADEEPAVGHLGLGPAFLGHPGGGVRGVPGGALLRGGDSRAAAERDRLGWAHPAPPAGRRWRRPGSIHSCRLMPVAYPRSSPARSVVDASRVNGPPDSVSVPPLPCWWEQAERLL